MDKNNQIFDVIIVGGGIAGLTAAAYLTKENHRILLVEKEDECGGLVNSFEHNGFIFDGGIRALENAGVLFTMLRKLGIEIEFIPNNVSLGIRDDVITLQDENSLEDYKYLLSCYFPEFKDEISEIAAEMKKISSLMDIQYGIENPIFLDPIEDRKYFLTNVFPWMFKYLFTAFKMNALDFPVRDYLHQFTDNTALIDVISQHFFTDTPANFALSYLKLYLDYHYPMGGTGKFIQSLVNLIVKNKGTISTATEITEISPHKSTIRDNQNNTYRFNYLIWAADQKTLYRLIDNKITAPKVMDAMHEKQQLLKKAKGNNSILTLYIASCLPPSYFEEVASAHFFYTPTIAGDSIAGRIPIKKPRREKEKWLDKYLGNTTYEISFPVLRDATLAPPNKTGLIVSVLFDYSLTKEIQRNGWYDALKKRCEQKMITTLNNSIFPGLADSVEDVLSSTPLTIQEKAGTFQGAINGWSYSIENIPAENRLTRITNAVNTPFENIYQAGMWTYSPSGFPVALITGKLASDQISRKLKSLK